MALPVELLGLGGDLEFDTFLFYRCVSVLLTSEGDSNGRWLTKIVDVEDTADGAAGAAVLDLALRRRGRGVVNGRVDFGQVVGVEI